MAWTPSNLIVKGVEAGFHQAMKQAPEIWRNHCMELPATTEVMPFAFPGFVPQPREFISGRQFKGLLDFTFNVTNKTYELSFAIPRKYFEDDQTGLIQARINEAAAVWSGYRNYRFAALLTAGGTSGSNAWDGSTFYADTRVVGDSANIDNNTTTVAAADDAVPTSAELLTAMQGVLSNLWAFQDDTGRPFNDAAMGQIRLVTNPALHRACVEAFSAPILSNNTNQYGFKLSEWDITPYLAIGSTTQLIYVSANGDYRKPFGYSSRVPLEVIVDQRPEEVASSDSVKVMCRERDIFFYAEPRRSVRHTFTT